MLESELKLDLMLGDRLPVRLPREGWDGTGKALWLLLLRWKRVSGVHTYFMCAHFSKPFVITASPRLTTIIEAQNFCVFKTLQ